MRKNLAFTLVELSVVLAVIAILVTGVIQGAAMVKSSRLSTARSLTAKSIVPEIDGLIAWYETTSARSFESTKYFNGATTGAWYDSNPASIPSQRNTLSRAASSAVTYRLDGIGQLPSVSFSGSSSNLSLSSFFQGGTNLATIFIVFKPNAAISGTRTLLDGFATTFSTSITSTAVTLNAGSAASTGTTTNGASFSNRYSYIAAIYFNDSSSAVYLNNIITRTGGANINPTSTNSLNGLYVGSTRANAANFNGFISEVIIYNRPLSISERRGVFKYLSNKYQITVIDS